MRFMVIYPATKESEQGALPNPRIMADMNTALNASCHITGDYQLRRDKKYAR